jgi:hypothetical protein
MSVRTNYRRNFHAHESNNRNAQRGALPIHPSFSAGHSGGVEEDILSSNANSVFDDVNEQPILRQSRNEYMSSSPERRISSKARNSVALPVSEFSQNEKLLPEQLQHASWQIQVRLWSDFGSEEENDIKEISLDLPQFIYQGTANCRQDEVQMMKNSKLRWFHLPVNNVRVNQCLKG